MIISFDFPELIFISFCTAHLAAMSSDSWITETPFLSHASNNVLSSTYITEQVFLNRLCKLGNISVQTGFPGRPECEYSFPIFTC